MSERKGTNRQLRSGRACDFLFEVVLSTAFGSGPAGQLGATSPLREPTVSLDCVRKHRNNSCLVNLKGPLDGFMLSRESSSTTGP